VSTSGQPPSDVLLEVRGVSKVFPGVKALDDVDFDVRPGRVVALIGENGAGKSTLTKVLSGVYLPDGGRMRLEDEEYSPAGPRDAAEKGVVLIHQELSLLPNLTLAENIFVGREPRKHGLLDRRALNKGAEVLLERVGLGHLKGDTMTSLCSVAVQQLVEIAKALSQDPRVLVFDEPTAPLGDDEVKILYSIVDDLKHNGVGIVWITHRLGETARVADEIVVLRDGQRAGAWDHGDVPVDQMIEAMVGRSIDKIFPTIGTYRPEVVLEVRELTRAGEFENVSFELHAGEVLGIAGLVGAGRTELVESIAGARRPDSGEVFLDGQPLTIKSPRDAIAKSIVLVPEDRKNQGLAQDLTIEDNIGLPKRAFIDRIMNNRRLHDEVVAASQSVNLKGLLPQLARTLSGGNQQKGVIAKWLLFSPRVFIFDEPTRGIDVGARSAIYEMIHELASRGAAIIAVSSELPEVMGISNRILVLSGGRAEGILEREEFSETAIMRLAVADHMAALGAPRDAKGHDKD